MSHIPPCWLTRHLPDLVAMRHDFHSHPEIGTDEKRTSEIVAETLSSWGIEVAKGVGGYGVVGTIVGKNSGHRSIGLRADMDALPIEERTELPYASRNTGLMHACGHDGHMVMLLGAARYLGESRDFAGTVHLIFQPAEEGRGGAKAMLGDGLFNRFPCDAIYGLHNTAGMPVGRFGTRSGAMMASSDVWEVRFHGRGGHGGVGPHLANDVTYASAHFVLGLQGIVGRNVAPVEPATLSVGFISGGDWGAPNVIPTTLVIRGTARSHSEVTRTRLENRIAALVKATASAWECKAEFDYRRGPPALVNSSAQVGISVAAASDVVTQDNVDSELRPTTGADDFAQLLQQVPGAYMRIGNGIGEDGVYHATHTPRYDFNDAIIPMGIKYWVTLVHRELGVI